VLQAGLERPNWSAVIAAGGACEAGGLKGRDDACAVDADTLFTRPWAAELEEYFGPDRAQAYSDILIKTGISLAGPNDIMDRPGRIYISRDEKVKNPAIFHVGETTADLRGKKLGPAAARVFSSHKQCGRPYELVGADFGVCRARLGERLIHAELRLDQGPEAKEQLKEAGFGKGVTCSSCEAQHIEWFFAPEEKLRKVIQWWCDFVDKHDSALLSNFCLKHSFLPL
jgi:hypothetical protein